MPPARSDSEKDPNPLLFPFVRDFCRRQAPFSRPRRSPTRFSSRTPFARPDWRSARRRSGARQFFRSQQDFFEVQKGNGSVHYYNFSETDCSVMSVSDVDVASAFQETSRRTGGSRTGKYLRNRRGHLSSHSPSKNLAGWRFFFFSSNTVKIAMSRSHRSATAGVTDTPFASTLERFRETARFRAR
jgi:hypothetical protein